jgi:hypothetical protein
MNLTTIKSLIDALPIKNSVLSGGTGVAVGQLLIAGLGVAGVIVPGPWQPIVVAATALLFTQLTPNSIQDCAKDLMVKAADLKDMLPDIQPAGTPEKNAGSKTGKT